MTTTVIDLIRKQQELKDRLVPKNVQAILDLQKKFSPYKDSLLWNLKDTLDIATHSKKNLLSTNAFATALEVARHNEFFTQNLRVPDIIKAQSEAISIGVRPISALLEAVKVQNNNNLSFATDFFKMSQFSNLSALSSLLRQPNTSTLSQSFEFARFNTKSFVLPDFSELDLDEDDNEEKKELLIQISPAEIPTIIKEFYADQSRLDKMNGHKFEEVIAELLRYHGYEVIITKKTRDGGFDMTLYKTLDDGRPFKAIVECKRRKKKISVEMIRCFSAVAFREGFREGIIVTSSFFSPDAVKESKMNMPADLLLKDRNDVLSWAGSYVANMPIIDLDLSKSKSKGGIILAS